METDDRALVERIRDDDHEAFRELLERHGSGLYGYLLYRLRDRTQADDAYAEVMMKVWKGAAKYREEGRLKAWLFTIAHRLCLDFLRCRRPIESLDAPQREEGQSVCARVAAPEPGPERQAESSLARERIASALAALPDAQREVFLMREYGGLSFAEIARVLDCPLATALARMRYAVLKLRRDLEELHA